MFFLGWAGLGEVRPKTDFFYTPHTVPLCLGRAMRWAPKRRTHNLECRAAPIFYFYTPHIVPLCLGRAMSCAPKRRTHNLECRAAPIFYFYTPHTVPLCLERAMSWAPSMFFLGWAGLGEVRPKINVAGGAPVSSNLRYS